MPLNQFKLLTSDESLLLADSSVKKYKAICSNYRDLQEHIMHLTSAEIEACIAVERSDRKRFNILNRLHMRYCEIRKNNERAQLYT